MRFAVVTLGSAGDLHPFLAVARALVERGHAVHLLTQATYEAAVRAEGVEFSAVATQADHERTQRHPLLWHPISGFGVLWRYLAVPAIGPTVAVLGKLASDGPLTVFASPMAVGARLARELWPSSIRLLSGYTAPMGLRSIADPMFLGSWQVPSWTPPWVRRGLWAALDRWKLEPMAQPVLRRWTDRLEMGAFKGSAFGDVLHSPDGGIALYPSWFATVPEVWAARGVRQTGFPVFEPRLRPELDDRLATFLADSRPYAVLYPGSAMHSGRSLERYALPACRAVGLRALLLSARGAPQLASGPDQLHVGQASLARVLPKARAFGHHGGIGSLAQGLAAGVPQLISASAYDQFENGARLKLMCQGEWLRSTETTTESVQRLLRQILDAGHPQELPERPYTSVPREPNRAVIQTSEILESTQACRSSDKNAKA